MECQWKEGQHRFRRRRNCAHQRNVGRIEEEQCELLDTLET